jgi:hypothetical protein
LKCKRSANAELVRIIIRHWSSHRLASELAMLVAPGTLVHRHHPRGKQRFMRHFRLTADSFLLCVQRLEAGNYVE